MLGPALRSSEILHYLKPFLVKFRPATRQTAFSTLANEAGRICITCVFYQLKEKYLRTILATSLHIEILKESIDNKNDEPRCQFSYFWDMEAARRQVVDEKAGVRRMLTIFVVMLTLLLTPVLIGFFL